MADVTFPSLPHVVSLLHYDNIARTSDNLHPPAGYPVICVTVSQAETSHDGDISGIELNLIACSCMLNWNLTDYRLFIRFFCNEVAGLH